MLYFASFPLGVEFQKSDSSLPSYIDLEADTGRVILSLPGPRDDAAYPSYEIILHTNKNINPKENFLKIQLRGDRNRSKIISLIDQHLNNSTKTKKTLDYFLYGICCLGKVSSNIYSDNHCLSIDPFS